MAFTGPDAFGRSAAGAPPRRTNGTSSDVPQDQSNPVQARTSTPCFRKPAPSGKGGRSRNALEPTRVLGPWQAKAHGAAQTPSPRAKGKRRATAKAEGSVLGRRQKPSRQCWQNPACCADRNRRPRALAEDAQRTGTDRGPRTEEGERAWCGAKPEPSGEGRTKHRCEGGKQGPRTALETIVLLPGGTDTIVRNGTGSFGCRGRETHAWNKTQALGQAKSEAQCGGRKPGPRTWQETKATCVGKGMCSGKD